MVLQQKLINFSCLKHMSSIFYREKSFNRDLLFFLIQGLLFNKGNITLHFINSSDRPRSTIVSDQKYYPFLMGSRQR